MSAFSVGQLSVQPPSPLPSETAIKEYLMWCDARDWGRHREDKKNAISPRRSEPADVILMPIVITIFIQNMPVCLHTWNPGRGDRSHWERETHNRQDPRPDIRRLRFSHEHQLSDRWLDIEIFTAFCCASPAVWMRTTCCLFSNTSLYIVRLTVWVCSGFFFFVTLNFNQPRAKSLF